MREREREKTDVKAASQWS